MITKAQSENDYNSGRWESLNASREIGQYALMAGLARHAGARDMLEVGCGTSNLFKYILGAYHTYHGIDISPKAIEIARDTHRGSSVTFQEADYWSWEPTKKFDAIFFSGSLYYLGKSYERSIDRTVPWLKPEGIVITSLYREYMGAPNWEQLETFQVSNLDTFWTVSAFKPRRTK